MYNDIEVYYKENIPYNLRISNKWIHSKFPEIEAKRQFEELKKILNSNQNIKTIFFIKVGLGYIIDLFLQENYQLYWYEKDPKIKNFAIERIEKKYNQKIEKFSNLNFISSFDGEFLLEWKEKLLFTEIFYFKTYLEKQDYIMIDLYYRKKFFYSVNFHTVKKFEKIWISNFYKNFIYFSFFDSIDSLKNILMNQPVLLISGGPSLDYWIDLIQKYQTYFFIICVDTALSTLIENQIQPDFVISVDSQLMNYLHLERYISKIRFLIIDPVISNLTIKNCIKNENSKIFVFNNSLPFVSNLYSKIFKEFSFLKSGGSVTTTALDFAKFLNAKPIFLCGTDFAFVNNLIHTQYSRIEKRFLWKFDRIHSLEFFNYKQLTAIPRRFCLTIDKKPIPTNDKLLIFKEWLEKNYDSYKENELYLLYRNGAEIKNINKILTKEEFLKFIQKFPELKLNKEEFIREKIKQNSKNYKKDLLNDIYKKFIILKEYIDKILNLIEKKEGLIEISEIENQILEIEELKLLQFTEIHKFMFLNSQNIESNLQQTKEIYQTIQETLKIHLNFLEKSLLISQVIE